MRTLFLYKKLLMISIVLFLCCCSQPMPSFVIESEDYIVWPNTDDPWIGDTHAATIIETKEKELIVCFKGGNCEKCPGHNIWLSRLTDGDWTRPVLTVDAEAIGPGYATENPVLFQPEDGPLMLFFYTGPSVQRDENNRLIDSTRSNMWGMLQTSADNGRSWSEPRTLGFDERIAGGRLIGPTKNTPIQRPDGSILVATNNEPGLWDGARIFKGRTFHFEVSHDMGQTWQVQAVIPPNDTLRPIQPGFLNLGGGNLRVLGRNEGKGPETPTALSSDWGETWSRITGLSELPQTHSGICPLTLRNGAHICLLNPAGHWRRKLDLMISKDGEHWQHGLTLNPEDDGYLAHYPQAIQGSDGKLHVVFTYGSEDDGMGGHNQGIRYMLVGLR